MTKIYSPKDILYPQSKQLRTFRRGRVSVASEIRRQTRTRTNLERFAFRRLNTVFRRFLNTTLFIYKETGFFAPEAAITRLEEELFPMLLSFYRRAFLSVYRANEEFYASGRKDEAEALVFGRNEDIERLVNQYYRGKQLVLAGISSRVANQIQKEIQRLRAEELTLPQIARGISEKFSVILRNRAALIARTETHNVASYANHQYHVNVKENFGVAMKKRWISTADGRTRSFHADANGQTVDMDEDFIVGGMPMAHAGDSRGGARNVINCRCVIAYADENDIVN